MTTLTSIFEVPLGLLSPWVFLGRTLTFLPGTIFRLILAFDLHTLLSWSKLQTAWFSSFWSWAGPQIREGNDARIKALWDGRIVRAEEVSTPAHRPVEGIVIDVGPGVGLWVDLFAPRKDEAVVNGTEVRRRGGEKHGVTKVFGVEPSKDSRPHLEQQIRKAGLQDVYEIVPVGIEAIGGRIEKGSVDCISSILCLCSIPEPEKNIRELYGYLKKGGRWYLYEHVQAKKGGLAFRLYQAFVNIFWPICLGGCQICRDTEKSLRNAGLWENIDLAQPPAEPWYQTTPHILGVLTK